MVLIQQIVVDAQDTEAAGPQTCDAPLPLQQYGEPEVQRFWAIGFWVGQFGGGGGGGGGGVRATRVSRSGVLSRGWL